MSSIREISKVAGCSVATVSRALRGDTAVRPEKAQAVLHAAKQLGYHRDNHLGEMMSAIRRRTGNTFQGKLGLIWPGHRKVWMKDGSSQEIRAALFKRAKALHFSIEEFFLHPEEHLHSFAQFSRRGMHGLIFYTPSSMVRGLRSGIDLSKFSCVVIGCGLEHPEVNRVVVDSYAGMRTALLHARAIYGSKIAALWDFSSEQAIDRASEAAFLAFHPAGQAAARELFLDYTRLAPVPIRRLFLKYEIRCLILFQNVAPPQWMSSLVESKHWIGINHPLQKKGFGWVEFENECLGTRTVDLVVAGIHLDRSRDGATRQTVMIPPKWHGISSTKPSLRS